MAGKSIGYIVAGVVIAVACILIGVGAIYLCSASAPGVDVGSRVMVAVGLLLVGLVLMGIGVAIVWVVKTRGPAPIQQITQQLELDMPGDVSAEKLKCQNCGAELSKDDVSLVQGALWVKCPYCGSTYQLTEAPKW
jgi:DNA-directed RNA polymerase subunit RPC12/RpoP